MAEKWGICLLGKLGFGIPTNWNWQGDGGLPLTASSVTAYAVPPSPEGEGFEVPRPWLFPFIPDYRYSSRIGCSETSKGTMRRFCRGILPLEAEIQRIPLQSSRPGCSCHYAYSGEQRGSGGKRFVASPRRLCARGSMTLRRAKVAAELRCSIASEDKQSRDYVQRLPSHPLTRELPRRESLYTANSSLSHILS